MKKNFNKKPLIALFVIGLVVAIGGTIAYYTDVVSIPNIFGTKAYTTQVTETFTAPENWLPGQTVDKVVTAKNTGEIDVAVRAKYEEKWYNAGVDVSDPANRTAENQLKVEGTPVTSGKTTILMDTDASGNAEDKWTVVQPDGYYYYKTFLTKNGETNHFIHSVTLNSDAIPGDAANPDASVACTPSGDAVGKGTTVWSCASTDSLTGASYVLTVTVETVQADAYGTVWSGSTGLISAAQQADPQNP